MSPLFAVTFSYSTLIRWPVSHMQAMQMSWWDDLFAMKKPGKTEKREVGLMSAPGCRNGI